MIVYKKNKITGECCEFMKDAVIADSENWVDITKEEFDKQSNSIAESRVIQDFIQQYNNGEFINLDYSSQRILYYQEQKKIEFQQFIRDSRVEYCSVQLKGVPLPVVIETPIKEAQRVLANKVTAGGIFVYAIIPLGKTIINIPASQARTLISQIEDHLTRLGAYRRYYEGGDYNKGLISETKTKDEIDSIKFDVKKSIMGFDFELKRLDLVFTVEGDMKSINTY